MRKGKDRNAQTFQQTRETKKVQTIKNKGLMRKSDLVLIAAVASMLASCSNEKFLDDNQDSLEAIGFASYSEKSTRGNVDSENNLEFYHNTFAVYGTKVNVKDPTKFQYVFGGKAVTGNLKPDGVTCTYQTTADAVLGDRKYDGLRFWDKQANYKFIAYAPVSNANPIRYNYAAADSLVGAQGNWFKTNEDYVLQGTNLQATPTDTVIIKGFTVEAGEDLDLMISSCNSQIGKTHAEQVPLSFRHILSKLNVSIAKSKALQDCTVTINGLEITGLMDKGSYNESLYDISTSDSKVSGWTASKSDPYDYALIYDTLGQGGKVLNNGTFSTDNPPVFTKGKPFYFIESLVMPQSITAEGQVILTMNYTIQSGDYVEEFPYELDLYDVANLQKFDEGYNYTLNFTIDPDVIIFDANVSTWSDINANKIIEEED